MPKTGNNARGEKRMSKAGAAGKRADAPLLGQGAEREAFAGFGVSPGAAGEQVCARARNGGNAAAGRPPGERRTAEDGGAGARRNHLADDAEPAPQVDPARRSRMAADARDPAAAIPDFLQGRAAGRRRAVGAGR